MSTLQEKLTAARDGGQILESTFDNIHSLLDSSSNPLAEASITELVEGGEWAELNDRFFRKLAFGTGGLRGRTVGKVVTSAEQGSADEGARPEYPCVGTNSMNFFNLSRAMQGLVKFIQREHQGEGKPSIAIAHDTRHFSREFAEFCAKVATDLGVDAYLFATAVATPELSFAVRHLRTSAGVVLTASHNPSHDNGFKVSFSDGAQLIEPQATQLIELVNEVRSEQYDPVADQGTLHSVGNEMDEAYMKTLESLLLNPQLVADAEPPKIVFTNLHGVGGHIAVPILERLGMPCDTVAEQDVQDGAFPTVASPNPENAPALQMAVDQANATGADIVIGTDPDCDRMGVAVRGKDGQLHLLTGNQTGSLMTYYRVKTMIDQGIITDANREQAVVIKTFVTSALQDAICEHYGVGCVNTLTGFKYIAAKMKKYEAAIPTDLYDDYRSLSAEKSRELRLAHSRFYIFGAEESYGYLGNDAIRDKDGNGAVVMFAELAAYAKSLGKTIIELLDDIYKLFGYFLEVNKSKVFEGAEGAAKIAKLAASYADNPPAEVDGSKVVNVRDFSKDEIYDEEGDLIPKEKMLFVDLEDGRSFAVRPSGTEPKIKYYLFANRRPDEGSSLSDAQLATAKAEVGASIDSLWAALESDIDERLA
ncbi:phospho-sugar mutase [Sulfuriroseicoccus oceanibius]|uniref:Phospho-sugar mutase n=1 Tax=Sulfuriroseicoccus oceanibius TaxID=2707525 RepID=A0A6B3L345_9BACT|nr:phospho-sugar mutase [Sulfuriroseicoccus oceanibius]QQL44192.1 phospho-sugar mutase [Sulfuriroseicoccus oceanibius]